MRSLITLAVAFVLLLLQSTVLEFAPLNMVTPSFGLLITLHVGISPRWSLETGTLVAFATGYLYDLVSGAPLGVHAFVYVLILVFARLLAARVAVRGIGMKAAVAFVASLLAAILIVVLRAQLSFEGGYGGLRQAPFEAVLTALVAPPLLWLLAQTDGRADAAALRVGLARRRPVVLGDGPRQR